MMPCWLSPFHVLTYLWHPRIRSLALLSQSITGIHVADSEPAAKQEAEERQRLMQVQGSFSLFVSWHAIVHGIVELCEAAPSFELVEWCG